MMSDPRKGDESVPCKECWRLTRMTGTQLCDACWEVGRHCGHLKERIKELEGRLERARAAWIDYKHASEHEVQRDSAARRMCALNVLNHELLRRLPRRITLDETL